jgi:hypothetical protein
MGREPEQDLSWVTPHVMRHTFGSLLAIAGESAVTKLSRRVHRGFRSEVVLSDALLAGWQKLPTKLCRRTRWPLFPSRAIVHADASRRICGNYGSFLLEPGEKGAQAHHVALSGGFGHTAAFLPVESLQIGRLDRRDRCSRSDPARKPFQREFLVFSRKPTEFIPGKFESDEGFDFSLQRPANCEIGTICQFECHAYRVAFLPSFERDRLAFPHREGYAKEASRGGMR